VATFFFIREAVSIFLSKDLIFLSLYSFTTQVIFLLLSSVVHIALHATHRAPFHTFSSNNKSHTLDSVLNTCLGDWGVVVLLASNER
jgi:hypothetical protein